MQSLRGIAAYRTPRDRPEPLAGGVRVTFDANLSRDLPHYLNVTPEAQRLISGNDEKATPR
jgi:hypothetical protein